MSRMFNLIVSGAFDTFVKVLESLLALDPKSKSIQMKVMLTSA